MPAFQESCAEQIQAQTIIVIHPGSLYLRIGRASDLNPHTLLHVVARRRLPSGALHHDTFLPQQVPKTKELVQGMEDSRLQVSHTLQSCLQSDGRRRYATPPQQIAAFNRRSSPEVISSSGGEWIKPDGDVVVGDEVLYLNAGQDFNIHFPYQRGDLYVHSGPGGSITAVLANLETIWTWAIRHRLEIPLRDLRHYKAVLIVPDIYNRQYLKELTTLLLCKIGFGGCFLLQDHVAATFGAGLGYACVVDVGDQKTSVSCVEDGISHRNTRVRMEYGGGDITQTFYWLLQKCAFPYKTCNPDNKLDAMLLKSLKESFCHVNLDICGSQEKTFVVRQPKTPTSKFTLQVGDECIVAPLSLFQPELFGVTGPKLVHIQQRASGDPEDPHDENYLRETSRRGMKESLEPLAGGLAVGDLDGLTPGLDCSGGVVPGEEDIVVDAIDSTAPSGGREGDAKEFVLGPEQALGLDQAVLQSIDRCPTEDLKRKMYGCILVVGGGMKFIGIGTWLQNRISLQIPYMYRAEQLDIITMPKEMDPQMTAWKGAAIMSCLESAQELWIYPVEWEKVGVKILRERAPFMW
ncbi:actin-related protein 8 isoform X4 [Zootermopsis nevadensis]|uniref:Actin-related protein 8 n=1 Tax=Zootermopsis nevadensis TaxID=136037 RepID=A0A067R771_ZOONE|nr:actin-related protein 8 isoform X4 [Zootermopsis nevadensis]KDR14149.1 Actin-related protein 8 [Zootermopsis nevadensis]